MSNSDNIRSITIAKKRLSSKGVSIDVSLHATPDNWIPFERLIPSISSIPFQVTLDFSAKNSNLFTARTVKLEVFLNHHDENLLTVSKDYDVPNKFSQLIKKNNHVTDTSVFHLNIPVCDDIAVEDKEIEDLNREVLNSAKVFRMAKIMYRPTDVSYIEALDQVRSTKEQREVGIKIKTIEKHMLHIMHQIDMKVS
jgi:hypothetical protein